MSKIKIKCDWCGCDMEKYPSKIHKHNFCGRKCLAEYSSKSKNPEGYSKLKDYAPMAAHMSRLNSELNPGRMTPEVRRKLRETKLGTGEGKTYTKLYGRHEHRVVAEKKIGRPLGKGEVVHHIDRDKRNNTPANLMVFSSQREHVAWHALHDRKRGDAT